MKLSAISRWFFVVAAAVVVAVPAVALTDAPAVALADKEKQAIADRIKPVGVVCLDDGTNCPVVSGSVSAPVASAEVAPAVASTSVASAPAAAGGKSGEEIFKTTCSVCHAAGVAGAPKVGDKGVWAPRIAKGKDTLYKNALAGFNAMPPKGMCAACSDSEIKATVDYMVSQSK